MDKLHLRQIEFAFSGCSLFTKHSVRIQKLRETISINHIYKDELDQALLVHVASNSDGKYLAQRTIPDNILKK